MQQICPVCNGIASLAVPCPLCGKIMSDLGHASDYYGPYSPYEEDFWKQCKGQAGECIAGDCIHLLECQDCRQWKNQHVDRISI